MNPINLETYLNNGVEQIIKDILKASLKNPKTSMFMMNYVKSSKKSKALRNAHANNEEHIPPFLIASITNKCNLHCNGCYARANNSCTDNFSDSQMTGKQWGNVFKQASELGIGFILLAGGEPMMRPDVLLEAGKAKIFFFQFLQTEQ